MKQVTYLWLLLCIISICYYWVIGIWCYFIEWYVICGSCVIYQSIIYLLSVNYLQLLRLIFGFVLQYLIRWSLLNERKFFYRVWNYVWIFLIKMVNQYTLQYSWYVMAGSPMYALERTWAPDDWRTAAFPSWRTGGAGWPTLFCTNIGPDILSM